MDGHHDRRMIGSKCASGPPGGKDEECMTDDGELASICSATLGLLWPSGSRENQQWWYINNFVPGVLSHDEDKSSSIDSTPVLPYDGVSSCC